MQCWSIWCSVVLVTDEFDVSETGNRVKIPLFALSPSSFGFSLFLDCSVTAYENKIKICTWMYFKFKWHWFFSERFHISFLYRFIPQGFAIHETDIGIQQFWKCPPAVFHVVRHHHWCHTVLHTKFDVLLQVITCIRGLLLCGFHFLTGIGLTNLLIVCRLFLWYDVIYR